jgi:hypothetical protein
VVYIGRMSSLCYGGQHSTEMDWMGEFAVAVYYIMMLNNFLKMIVIDRNMGL